MKQELIYKQELLEKLDIFIGGLISNFDKKIENMDNLVDLEKYCPLNISKVIFYYRKFKVRAKFPSTNNPYIRRKIAEARIDFNNMISSLSNLFSDKEEYKDFVDRLYIEKFENNLRVLTTSLNDFEKIAFHAEEEGEIKESTGLIIYIRTMKSMARAIIDTLILSTKEFYLNKPKDKRKESRSFLYILFLNTANILNLLAVGKPTDMATNIKKAEFNLGGFSSDEATTEEGRERIKKSYIDNIVKKEGVDEKDRDSRKREIASGLESSPEEKISLEEMFNDGEKNG